MLISLDARFPDLRLIEASTGYWLVLRLRRNGQVPIGGVFSRYGCWVIARLSDREPQSERYADLSDALHALQALSDQPSAPHSVQTGMMFLTIVCGIRQVAYEQGGRLQCGTCQSIIGSEDMPIPCARNLVLKIAQGIPCHEPWVPASNSHAGCLPLLRPEALAALHPAPDAMSPRPPHALLSDHSGGTAPTVACPLCASQDLMLRYELLVQVQGEVWLSNGEFTSKPSRGRRERNAVCTQALYCCLTCDARWPDPRPDQVGVVQPVLSSPLAMALPDRATPIPAPVAMKPPPVLVRKKNDGTVDLMGYLPASGHFRLEEVAQRLQRAHERNEISARPWRNAAQVLIQDALNTGLICRINTHGRALYTRPV